MSNEFLDGFAKQIMEANSYQSVLILASKKLDNNDTQAEHSCAGNYYAHLGLAKEFLIRDEERNRKAIRNEPQSE